MYPIRDYIVAVLEKNQLTDDVFEVVAETGGMEWETGQYVSVIVGLKETGNSEQSITLRRSYSMSTLSSSKKVGFIVDTKPMGPGSQLFLDLKVGDQISFKGPLGKFTLDSQREQSKSKNLIFVATGTGIGPIRAMIDELLTDELKIQSEKLKVSLFFALRGQKDIFWREHFDSLREQYQSKFEYQIVLSRPENDWHGLAGHVTEHIIEQLPANPYPLTSDFYLCGNLGMISDVSRGLKERGVPTENIHFESYYSKES